MDMKQVIFSDFLSDSELKELVEKNIVVLQDFLETGDIDTLRDKLTQSRDELLATYHLNQSLK